MWQEFVFTRAVFMAVLWLLAGNGMMMTESLAEVGSILAGLGWVVLMGAVLLYSGLVKLPPLPRRR